MSADAIRFERPLACVAFGLEWPDHPSTQESAADARVLAHLAQGVADALKSVTRVSDTVGRLATGEFIIVAPGTDRNGAERLADRVLQLVSNAAHPATDSLPLMGEEGRLRAGFFATAGEGVINPEDLLFKATVALRRAQVDDTGIPVRSYEA